MAEPVARKGGVFRRIKRNMVDWGRRNWNRPSDGVLGTIGGAIAGYHYGGQNLRGTAIGAGIGLTVAAKKAEKLQNRQP